MLLTGTSDEGRPASLQFNQTERESPSPVSFSPTFALAGNQEGLCPHARMKDGTSRSAYPRTLAAISGAKPAWEKRPDVHPARRLAEKCGGDGTGDQWLAVL